MIKAVIFDMDGLMFSTESLAVDALVQAGTDADIPVTRDDVYALIGSNRSDAQSILSKRLGREVDYSALHERSLAYIMHFIKKNGMPVKSGLYELLTALKAADIPMTVATSSQKKTADAYFRAAGVTGFFPDYISGDRVSRGKPDPEIYLRAAALLGVATRECCVLEDSGAGVESACRAGAQCVLVPDLIPAEKIPFASKAVVVKTLLDAKSHIFSQFTKK